jgi:hypothetical protein
MLLLSTVNSDKAQNGYKAAAIGYKNATQAMMFVVLCVRLWILCSGIEDENTIEHCRLQICERTL